MKVLVCGGRDFADSKGTRNMTVLAMQYGVEVKEVAKGDPV